MSNKLIPKTSGHGFVLLLGVFALLFAVLLAGFFIDERSASLAGLISSVAIILVIYGGVVLFEIARLKLRKQTVPLDYDEREVPVSNQWVETLDFSPLLDNAPQVPDSERSRMIATNVVRRIIEGICLIVMAKITLDAQTMQLAYLFGFAVTVSIYLYFNSRIVNATWPFYRPHARAKFAEQNGFSYTAEADLMKQPFWVKAVRKLDRMQGVVMTGRFDIVFFSEPYSHSRRRQYVEVILTDVVVTEAFAASLPVRFKPLIAASVKNGDLVFTYDSYNAFDMNDMRGLFAAIETAARAGTI